MIPKDRTELALLLYMMEVNEWGASNLEDGHSNAKELAKASFEAADAFFEVAESRNKPKVQKPVRVVGKHVDSTE